MMSQGFYVALASAGKKVCKDLKMMNQQWQKPASKVWDCLQILNYFNILYVRISELASIEKRIRKDGLT